METNVELEQKQCPECDGEGRTYDSIYHPEGIRCGMCNGIGIVYAVKILKEGEQ